MKSRILKFRSTLIISTFLRNVSHMPRLHTAIFSGIRVKQKHLALLFQSNSLRHLVLSRCSLPRSVRLPPSPAHHLTLSLGDSCKHVEPLLGYCSANLEALDFTGHLSQPPGSMRLPRFPKLRELKFDNTSGSKSDLDTLIFLAPQLEHLEIYGRQNFLASLALPAHLNRLTINQWAISGDNFGINYWVSRIDDISHRRWIHLPHLHITHFNDHRRPIIRIMQRVFPNLTSLDLNIQWDLLKV